MSNSNLDPLEAANKSVYRQVSPNGDAQDTVARTILRRVSTDLTRRRPSLPSTPIRLLLLKKGSTPDRIELRLSATDLHRAPPYEALSYVWGDQRPLEVVKCNGMDFAIRKNLHSALTELRQPDKDRTLWVDAVCINQSDQQERNTQVAFMGHIYSHASNVIIWLGKQQEDQTAFASIKHLAAKLPGRHAWLTSGSKPSKRLKTFDAELRTYGYLDDMRFRHLLGLFSRPWFSRVWVIQEVVKADQATVHLGKESVPWSDFSKVFNALNEALMDLAKVHKVYGVRKYVDTSTSIVNLLAIHKLKTDHQDMSQFAILCVASSFKSTDPRDKLFALLSLGKSDDRSSKPNYLVPEIFEVFRDHVIFELQNRHQLQYLARPSTHSEWPSWVPDWTEKSRPSYFCTAVRHGFDASGDTAPDLSISPDKTILTVAGKQMDVIAELVPPLERSILSNLDIDSDGTTTPQLLEWLYKCLKCVNRELSLVRRYAESEIMPLLRTLACSGVYGRSSTRLSFSRNDPDVTDIRHILEALADAVRFDQAEERSRHLIDLASKFYEAVQDRQFFRTQKGRLGWVSGRAIKDDAICVLYGGGKVPFALRSTGNDSWKTIGECYVDGLMQGEAMEIHGIPRRFKIC